MSDERAWADIILKVRTKDILRCIDDIIKEELVLLEQNIDPEEVADLIKTRIEQKFLDSNDLM